MCIYQKILFENNIYDTKTNISKLQTAKKKAKYTCQLKIVKIKNTNFVA